MLETILLIILAGGIGLFHDINKPTQYELNMEDGSNTHVVLQKNSNYACPLYCEVDHFHIAVICNNDSEVKNNRLLYHISDKDEAGTAIFCSNKKILSMNRFKPKTAKGKLPDVVTASTDE